MADYKNGTEEGFGANEEERAPAVDCWELVGSGPSSPLPEAVVDGPALEAAVAAGSSPGDSLHDDYFACPRNLYDYNGLPLSTMMADQHSEQEAHSSERSDAFVSLDDDGEAIVSTKEYNEDIGTMTGSSNVHYNDFVLLDEDLNLDGSKCHDDNPYCMFLDENVASLEHGKIDEVNPVICSREMLEHDVILPSGYDDSACSEEDQMNQACSSITVVEFTSMSSNGHQLSTLAAIQEPGLSSTSHDMQENLVEIHPSSTEGGNSPTTLGCASKEEYSGQVEDLTNLRGSLVSIRNSKAFTCASWLWTQFCRWQAQLGYANTIWSMTLAAAVMGIIALGRGWQRLQAQNYSLRSQLWAKEKRITQLMFQLMQTKEALAKMRRVPVICVKPDLQVPQS